jgi:hypothetical protein
VSRRWFWPLFLAASLLLGLAGSLLATIAMFFLVLSKFVPVSLGDINLWLFVVVGVLTAIAVALFVWALRVR